MKKLTIEDLKKQAIRQRQSGTSYLSIGRYLESTGASKDEISEVISHLNMMEKENLIKPESNHRKVSFQSGFLGALFIFLGVVLTWALWGLGWVSTTPIVLIAVGLFAFGGTFDR